MTNEVSIKQSISMKIFSLFAVISILVSSQAFGQASLVRNRLQAVALGKGEDVKRELPDILAEFPDDPGVQFLHAVVLEDAARALKIYEKIVKDHPECEWADDSQWRIVQFYSLRKDTVRARKELKTYRDKYPQSEFLLNAAEMVKATVGVPKIDKTTATASEPKTVTTDVKPATKPTVPETKPVAKPPALAETKPGVKPTVAETKPAAKPTVAETKPAAKPTATETKPVAKPTATETKPTAKPAATEIKPVPKPGTKPTTAETKPGAKPTTASTKPNAPDVKAPQKPGTADVKAGAKAEPKESPKEMFSLQVGSYDTREAAENEVKNYKQKRMRASVTEKTIDGATKYAVFIGEYTSKESAEKAKELVQKSCNCTPFVVGK